MVSKTLNPQQSTRRSSRSTTVKDFSPIISSEINGKDGDEVDFESIEKKIFDGTGILPSKSSQKRDSGPRKGLWINKDNNSQKESIQVKVSKENSKLVNEVYSKKSSRARDNSGQNVNSSISTERKSAKGTSSNSKKQLDKVSPYIKKSRSGKSDANCSSSSKNLPSANRVDSNRSLKTNSSTTSGKGSRSKNIYQIETGKKSQNKSNSSDDFICKEIRKNDKELKKGPLSKQITSTKLASKKPAQKSINKDKSQCSVSKKERKQELPSDSENSDWEDVETNNANLSSIMKSNEAAALDILSKKTSESDEESSRVQIELDAPTLWGMRKKKKRKTEDEMIEDFLRRSVNQGIRESYCNCHKVHLLLLLGHGQHINRILNSDVLLGAALSIVTSREVYPPKRVNLKYLEQIVCWFSKKISLNHETEGKQDDWESMLLKQFDIKQAKSNKEFVLMFIAVGRALGMNVRLVQSLMPLPFKPPTDKLFRPPKKEQREEDDFMKASTSIIQKNPSVVVKKENKNKMISSDSDTELAPVPSKNKIKKVKQESTDDDFDSDFERKVKRSSKLQDKTVKFLKNVENGGQKKRRSSVTKSSGSKKTCNVVADWAEIFVEEEESWVCVDVVRGKIFCPSEVANGAPSPVCYVTAFNPDQTVKDVTKRYVSKWLSHEAKLRCDSAWWHQVLRPYAPYPSAREKRENDSLEEVLRQQPLPQTVAEYKNHPLYALQRHLLKYEALYPPNPDPIGFFKGEAVYQRSCVRTLHSRDIWRKNAKTVKVDEEAYKIVKAMPKWDRVNRKVITDRPLDLFGEWQVEDYSPPVAKDGKVPRNEYGNVELFKPTMLPIGCIHLSSKYEDINRIARKLGIDCAPAMVGFDFHKGGTHPVFDGYVVCGEFRDTLMDAWAEEMELKAKRAEARRVKRILDNWKRLVQGVIVKNHVRQVYGGGDEEETEKKTKKTSAKQQPKKRKIKQKDLDADGAPPGEVKKKEPVVLGIDLSSDTVTMAKKCFKDAQMSRGSVNPLLSDDEMKCDAEDSDEENKETEEEKKEKLRKILDWGKEADATLGLSEDEQDDCDDTNLPDGRMNQSGGQIGENAAALITNFKSLKRGLPLGSNSAGPSGIKSAKKLKAAGKKFDEEELESSMSEEDASTSALSMRRKKRKAAKKRKVYYESDEVSDISLGESDVEDKTYNPFSDKKSAKKSKSFLSDESD